MRTAIYAPIILSLPAHLAVAQAEDVRSMFHQEELSKSDLQLIVDQALIENSTNSSAYAGVAQTMLAKHYISPISKYRTFVAGRNILNEAIEKNENSAELRYLRLLVQLNAPKFLGYYHNISDDIDVFKSYIQDEKIDTKWKTRFIRNLLGSENIEEELRAELVQLDLQIKWANR